mgnify:CR=1 FL=1
MKKRTVIALILFLLFTTITTEQRIVISKFNLKKIVIENNFLIKEEEIKKLLASIYGKNLLSLENNEIEKLLKQNSFIGSFNVKKKYPNTLKIKIFEKEPIAVLQIKKEKYYLSEKIELIKFKPLNNSKELPYVIGNKNNFKEFYSDLKKINFPFSLVKKYTFYESNRWDIETINKKVIKLPNDNYIKSLENFLGLRNQDNFKDYKVFDYRINNQLILK